MSIIVYQAIGLKCFTEVGLVIWGIIARLVEFIPPRRVLDWKTWWIALTKTGLIMDHIGVKKKELKPSSPPILVEFKLKRASLISESEILEINSWDSFKETVGRDELFIISRERNWSDCELKHYMKCWVMALLNSCFRVSIYIWDS